MNFIHQHLLQRFYIHLPSLHEFYLPALAPKILYSLTWCLWILSTGTCPKILYSLKYPSTMNFIPKILFSSHTPLFWTLPEQISILYPTCVPIHPEPMSQDTPQNLRPQDFHLTHPCFELCRSRSPYYTPHVCQPILNQCPKTHHKTSDPKIFISHIPVLNLARTDVGFELRGAPNWSRDSSWTWSLGWKMWKGNKGHAYLNASNLTQGILLFSYVWLEQPQCLDVSTGSA